ncbi:MAG: ABC transporter ATP-binding protein [Longimicrobiales bacterium]
MNTGDVALLRAEGLTRSFDGRLAVAIDALEARIGEVLALLGPNGAGKSTLFRLLLLLERPDGGRILLGGREVLAGDLDAMRRLAGVFQRPFFFAGTVADNVGFGLAARGIGGEARARRVREALGWVHLDAFAHRDVRTLSGGEAQRVALARALVVQPDLLLLDEPTANLDVTAQRRFREDLGRAVREHARSAILITHDPGDAFELADRVAVIEDGQIVQTATPDTLLHEPASAFIAAITGAELLTARVEGVHERAVVVRLQGGARVSVPRAASPTEVRTGTTVRLAYRPERVQIGCGREAARADQILGRVVSRAPADGFVRVRLESAPPIAAVLTRDAAARLQPGADVVARLESSSVRLFDREAPRS